MRDEDLRRRLEKLITLKEHPSTLPAIREAAAKAEERVRAQMRESRPGQYRRSERGRLPEATDIILEALLRDMDGWTAEVAFPWHTHRPRGG